jgi:hypothetical protein
MAGVMSEMLQTFYGDGEEAEAAGAGDDKNA